ncbi:MAG: ribosome-binding factor A [Patescibacteria group bacterium]
MPHTRRLEEGGGMQHFRDALALVISQRVEFPPDVFVTILTTKLTRDTIHAKCVISVLPADREKDAIKVLKEANIEIKNGLTEHLRLRRIPRLHWTTDKTENAAAEIDAIIDHLKHKGEL